MNETVRATLLGALGYVLKPMVRLAIRNGLSYEDFGKGLKRVFVETILGDMDSPETPMTTARIAILTGIARSDVDEAKADLARGAGSDLERLAFVAQLIEGWHQDSEFTGPYGIPLELPIEPGQGSFPALMRRYCEDIEPLDMLDLLKRVGLARQASDGQVRLVTRSFIAGKFKPEAIERMGRTLGDLADTLEYNLNPKRVGKPRFERRVYTPEGVTRETLIGFRKAADELGQEFLEQLDNWLSEREQEEEIRIEKGLLDPDLYRESKTAKVGVGVFLFEHHDKNERTPGDGDSQSDAMESTN
jgi:hypothetical protein